jgi:hypothetical protein
MPTRTMLPASHMNWRQASEFIEQSLGERIDEQLTAEFHQNASQQQSNQQRL